MRAQMTTSEKMTEQVEKCQIQGFKLHVRQFVVLLLKLLLAIFTALTPTLISKCW